MPRPRARYESPDPAPDDVAAEINVLGNAARVDIIRVLAQRGGAGTRRHIEEATEMPTGSVPKHLRALEAAGVITVDRPAGGAHGRSLVYKLNPQRVKELSAAKIAWILGNTPPSSS